MECSTGTNTKGATDETRHEATEARHGRIVGNLGQEQDFGDPGLRDQLWQTGANVVMLEMGRMVVESAMLIEREEPAGSDYYPIHLAEGNL